jgi:hypothetical protein
MNTRAAASRATSQPAQPRPRILTQDEATLRLRLLAELQTTLAGQGIRCVLARTHRLVLRWRTSGPFGPCGLTDPQLHIFTPAGTTIATTDGTAYHLASGQDCPAADPAAAAALIRGHAAGTALKQTS